MTQDAFDFDLSNVSNEAQFASALRRLRAHFGWSLRELSERARLKATGLSKTSLGQFEAGARLPTKATLENLLNVCGITDPKVQERWEAARLRALGVVVQVPAVEEGPVLASKFFTDQDDLREIQKRIVTAQHEVWLWGAILEKHVPYLIEYFERALAENVKVKVLLIKPGDGERVSNAIAMSAFRAGKSTQALDKKLRISLDLLEPLLTHECFELRLVDYLGPYTLYAYDPDSPHGRMDLRLSSFRGFHELRPTFSIEHEHDADWSDYFFDQWTQIWDAGEPVLAEG